MVKNRALFAVMAKKAKIKAKEDKAKGQEIESRAQINARFFNELNTGRMI